MLSFRNDLINTLKPFFEELNNNIKKEKYIPLLKSLNNFEVEVEVLHKYKIINEETYANIAPKLNLGSTKSSESNKKEDKIVVKIIEGDKLEELQNLIREKDIKRISPITSSFKEVISS